MASLFCRLLHQQIMKTRSQSHFTKDKISLGKIQKIPTEQKFIAQIGTSKYFASVKYVDHGNYLELHHTKIPAAYRNRGIGCELAKEIFQYMKAHHQKVQLTCDFLIFCLKKYPEYKNIICC